MRGTIKATSRPLLSRGQADAALLDFLRKRGDSSELSAKETKEKLLEYFREQGCFERLLKVELSEPPRVRALL